MSHGESRLFDGNSSFSIETNLFGKICSSLISPLFSRDDLKRLIVDRRSDWFFVLRPFPSIWIYAFVSLFLCLSLSFFISRLFRRQHRRRWTQIFFVGLNLIYLIEFIFFLINIRRVEVSLDQSWRELTNRTSLRSFGAELNRIEQVFAGKRRPLSRYSRSFSSLF